MSSRGSDLRRDVEGQGVVLPLPKVAVHGRAYVPLCPYRDQLGVEDLPKWLRAIEICRFAYMGMVQDEQVVSL